MDSFCDSILVVLLSFYPDSEYNKTWQQVSSFWTQSFNCVGQALDSRIETMVFVRSWLFLENILWDIERCNTPKGPLSCLLQVVVLRVNIITFVFLPAKNNIIFIWWKIASSWNILIKMRNAINCDTSVYMLLIINNPLPTSKVLFTKIQNYTTSSVWLRSGNESSSFPL